MKKLVSNCKQATFLIEKQMMGSITFDEHISLRRHLLGCSMCTLYRKQSRIINEKIKQAPKSLFRLDHRFKQNLRNRIDEGLNKKTG